ncbi:MAG TPA: GNAT family N-acetyltransferase [Burkholderiaceae bacterium]|jgi:ribosomal protein S18 acetylase RimI-like enzyme|nr:GNAT family N-acetyltransferase [Burkholderiaceae bacterium]HPE01214.1 GNAT family N-acetyltransferase [Burkholderiaceae bacterium]HRZ01395.1 GNAT family N-acetyltransferase [Burkholderiaceae bacterium]
MNFRIEAARPQDCAVLVELIRALADYEKLAHLVQTTEEQVRAELFGPAPVIEALIGWEQARGGTRAVAFALYFHNYSTFLARRGLYLEDLFVVPEARRRGYGKALMRHLARTAVARGCGRFEWSVLDWNQPAIEFYESLGAEVMADWRICRMTGEALAEFGRAVPPA